MRSTKERNIFEILAFAKEHGRLPSEYSLILEERRLGRAMATIIAKTSHQYDAEFRAQILRMFPHKKTVDRPTGNNNPNRRAIAKQKKADVIDFLKAKRRMPRRGDKNEAPLLHAFNNYTKAIGNAFDPDFAWEAKRLKRSLKTG